MCTKRQVATYLINYYQSYFICPFENVLHVASPLQHNRMTNFELMQDVSKCVCGGMVRTFVVDLLTFLHRFIDCLF